MQCEIIEKYSGTMSQKLQKAINEKLRERLEKTLPQRVKHKDLIRTKKRMEKLSKEYNLAKKSYESVMNKLKIVESSSWNYDKYKQEYYISSHVCLIPVPITNQLKKAQIMSDLGQRKDAKKIWDTLIDKYELV